jgi:3-hydroxybutyryl-CoA dehydrogenase
VSKHVTQHQPSVDSVAIIGGGRMGAGIAHAFLLDGSHVTLVEPNQDKATAAHDRVMASLAKTSAKTGTDTAPMLARLGSATDASLINTQTGLVIEAVPEVFELKSAVLRAAEKRVTERALVASNTSSLSITRLGATLLRPDRFIGMHFFNPVPVSALVELITGQGTACETVAQAQDIVRGLRKASIVVRDSPGFATSRLGVALGLEAIRMLQDGVASAEDIDQAMVLGYRHPIGPLRLTDLVGLDVRLAVAEHLAATLGALFEPPQLLRGKVAAGALGAKTGEGFYVWR